MPIKKDLFSQLLGTEAKGLSEPSFTALEVMEE
jgi:hypothetical protein